MVLVLGQINQMDLNDCRFFFLRERLPVEGEAGPPAGRSPSFTCQYIISRSVTPTTHARALLIRAITLLIYLTNAISPYAFTYSQLLLLWRPRAPGVMLHDSREIRLACVTGGGGVRSRSPAGSVAQPSRAQQPGRTGGGVVSGELHLLLVRAVIL